MGNIEEINIKNRTYYFFDDMISIEGFHSNLLKIDKKSYKNINTYYNGYITMKDYVKVKTINPLYLVITEVDGHIEEKNENSYLIFNSANKNKEVLKKYTKLWNGIKNEIEKINWSKEGEHSSAEHGKDFMKIKFDTYDNLLLNKTVKLHNVTIGIWFIFEENGKFYPQIYLDVYLYEL